MAFKGFIVRSNLLLKILTIGFASGLTLFPFIFIKKHLHVDKTVINHERIHIAQQLETLFIGFYILYIFEYLKNRISMTHFEAYMAISFEREAFYNESNLQYLDHRKMYAFLKYF